VVALRRHRFIRASAAALFATMLLAGPARAGALEATPSVEISPPPVASGPPTITVVAVGDLLFDSAPGRLIRSQGPRAPFKSTARILRDADVTVGNLENPLSKRGRAVPGKTFTFRGAPRAADGLKWAGFDLVALGNNHARDYGAPALRDTFANLKRAGIAYAGAGTTRKAAWRPAIIERNGARIAFLSFSQIGPSSFAATSERSGTAYTLNRTAVNRAIKAAGKRADYVIVSFHWGVERDYRANARQVADGRAAIRAGADLVLSHHPHVIQGVEYYRDGLIAYSLGNFVFSPGSMAGRDSMILRLTLSPKGVSKVTAVPVWIGYDGRPVVQQGESAKRIIRIIKRTSTARGTTVTRSGSVARLRP
jgi:poly-gamma-glutamate synthesis protein (capsule biosynthesis protein)